jgi:epoxyqueuosine reductase
MHTETKPINYQHLADDIHRWGRELGFQQVGIAAVDLTQHGQHLQDWLDAGYHGDMTYMAEHGSKRSHPEELLPGTLRVISARMDYLPGDTQQVKLLQQSDKAYVSRYALGRDYHKLIRKRLSELANKIQFAVKDTLNQRPFVDSAPVLERALAEKAGLGWIGKNTMLINSKAGSWFFLGELFTNLPLPIATEPDSNHCGTCRACLDICPTQAFVGPYQLDARKCISYLTIEHKGSIPEELRKPMGNRVFGCDDCNIVCPWNKFAKPADEKDFKPRHGLEQADLVTLFNWTEAEFLQNTEGSAIRRIGYERWLRNIAVGLGNGPATEEAKQALNGKLGFGSGLVKEHVEWALDQLNKK